MGLYKDKSAPLQILQWEQIGFNATDHLFHVLQLYMHNMPESQSL